MASEATEWQEDYLKIALLWVDKPSFVRALIHPGFKPKSDHPTIGGTLLFNTIYSIVMIIYMVVIIATYQGTRKEKKDAWGVAGPGSGFSFFVILLFNSIFHIMRYKIWESPMTVKARISAIPPPQRSQDEVHALTYYKLNAFLGGTVWVSIGVLAFAIVGFPIGEMMAALFIRELMSASIERICGNKVCNSQAEAIILGVLGTGTIQFADNCSGDMVLKPSMLKALKWKDTKIRDEIKAATDTFEVALQIFDLDNCQPAAIKRSGLELLANNDEADIKGLMASFKEFGDEIKSKMGDMSV